MGIIVINNTTLAGEKEERIQRNKSDLLVSKKVNSGYFKDPVLPIEHCKLRSLGGHFCDVENSEAFVCGQNRTL